MKIRNGFVSNSSSSSFCLLGVKYDNKEELEKIVYNLLGITKKIKSLEEIKKEVIEEWETTSDEKTIEYYKWKSQILDIEVK